jgi:hypothetical protein
MSHDLRRPRQSLARALTLTLALSLALGSASCVGELSGGASGEGERTTQTAGDAVDTALYYAEHISVTAEAIRRLRNDPAMTSTGQEELRRQRELLLAGASQYLTDQLSSYGHLGLAYSTSSGGPPSASEIQWRLNEGRLGEALACAGWDDSHECSYRLNTIRSQAMTFTYLMQRINWESSPIFRVVVTVIGSVVADAVLYATGSKLLLAVGRLGVSRSAARAVRRALLRASGPVDWVADRYRVLAGRLDEAKRRLLGGSLLGPIATGTAQAVRRGATPNSRYVQLHPNGRAIQTTIYDDAGDAIGHVDWKYQHGAAPGHGHRFGTPGDPSTGHGGQGMFYPAGQLPEGWGELPPNVVPIQQ